ncbi:putative transposase of IS4/5 family DUF4096 [Streptomyces sp. HB202]|nr:putative transposase of IS4/5 family DUF4096 [Streptomyces sp. HB202]
MPDDLWARFAPILPPPPQRRNQHPGRRRTDDRIALAGILFVLRTGAAWRDVPRKEIGCPGVTAWRRLRDWTEAGVWPRLHAAILAELRKAGLLEMDDCAIDGSHVRSLKGRAHTGPSPIDRGPPRKQTPHRRRPEGHTSRSVTHRWQPTRCHSAHPAHRCHPTHSWTTRTATPSPATAVRRPRLRLRQVPETSPAPRHSAQNRPPRCPSRLRLGQDPLGCRAHLRLAPPVQETPDPLRDAC